MNEMDIETVLLKICAKYKTEKTSSGIFLDDKISNVKNNIPTLNVFCNVQPRPDVHPPALDLGIKYLSWLFIH